MESRLNSGSSLAADITRTASKQTFYTIRFLVDSQRVEDAYRAYAYFRWVDDWLDQGLRPRADCLAFIVRQQELVESCLRGVPPDHLAPQETMLVSLIQHDPDRNSGLHTYIRSMMAVMAFDAGRRGRLISQAELNEYTHALAVAVTEAMHYFIGHGCGSPRDSSRYLAVTGAHITHILRDTLEDIAAGYYNLPAEQVAARGIDFDHIDSQAFRDWVREYVQKARGCFKAGREAMAQVENIRCRIAGYAYIRCFEGVLDSIEREGYLLRAHYPERAAFGRRLEMVAWALWMACTYHRSASASSVLSTR